MSNAKKYSCLVFYWDFYLQDVEGFISYCCMLGLGFGAYGVLQLKTHQYDGALDGPWGLRTQASLQGSKVEFTFEASRRCHALPSEEKDTAKTMHKKHRAQKFSHYI